MSWRIKKLNWKLDIFGDLDFKEPHWENRLFNVDFKLLYSLYLSTKINKKVKQLFSLVTYEESESPAMKHAKHIHGVNDLVQEINNIVQHRQECQTMECDVQFICCSCKSTDTIVEY